MYSIAAMRVGLLALLLWPALASPTPTIQSIVIQGQSRTRQETVRRELLFALGEPLDSVKIAESERNLRRLLFLGRADIAVTQKGQQAHISVTVEDLYARAFSILLSGDLQELNYGLTALDYNFLGRGQTLQLTLEHQAISGNGATLAYQAPRLARTAGTLTATVGKSAEGHDLQAQWSRPFRSLADPWSYGLSLSSRQFNQRLYRAQALSSLYSDRLDAASLWLTRSYGAQWKVRPSFRLGLSDRHFNPGSGYTYAPAERRRVLPRISLTLWRPNYEQSSYIHFLGRVEDLQVGPWIIGQIGLSHKQLGSDSNFLLHVLQIVPHFKPTPRSFAFVTLTASARQNADGLYNFLTQAQLASYWQWGPVHRIAARLRWESIHRPEDSSQFLLGLNTGLRGYGPRRFDGSRRFVAALEGRPLLYRHPAVVVAGALFVENGAAWTPGQNRARLRWDMGIGARLGLPQVYNTPVLRADLAYGFDDKRWYLSVGMGQYF
ncbi:MAG: hypothetical protein GKR89_31770 [Candidatus Latescibacteria bacterium]|nr:hypothetical protein [Candidatus Latescibacterota bacterium]